MSQLHALQLSFGRAGAAGKSFSLAFDLAFPTQALIHKVLAGGQLCDPPLVSAVIDFLEPGDTFLDVGSHIGYFSFLALQMVGAAGRVLAFEPNPQTYSVLVASALANQSANLYAYNCAVGDRQGIAAFHVNRQDEGMSSLVFRGTDSTQLNVHVTTLDVVAALAGIKHIRTLKIDVEGFEEHVIQGASALIASGAIESIVFEVNNGLPSLPRDRDLVIRRFLRQHGFTSYLIRPWMGEDRWQAACGQTNYYRLPDESPLDIAYGNILATRRQVLAAQ